MKVKVEFITARLNGKILFVEAINDCYTEVQVIVYKRDLDEESIKALHDNKYICEYEDSFNLDSCEAKDACDTYGNLVVSIETKEIDFE